MAKRVAHGREAVAEVARELFIAERRAGIQNAVIGPGIEIVEQPKILHVHAKFSEFEFLSQHARVRESDARFGQLVARLNADQIAVVVDVPDRNGIVELSIQVRRS